MSHTSREVSISILRELLNSTTPARDVVHRHGCSYRGVFQSTKAFAGAIPFESGLARDALRTFELAPEVTMIVPEPFTFHYEMDGLIRNYTPDYLLFLRDGRRAVVEVKWQAEADQTANQLRFDVIGKQMARANAMFAVLTERQLRDPVLQKNMSLIESHKHLQLSTDIISKILHSLRHGDQLLEQLTDSICCQKLVLAAIGQGILAVDLRSPLTNKTKVRRV
ncbi:hypothetical protein [Chromobacterium subtsugae]|uniref:hypothetical protein n=1 Tax=Chromobacterium subtsugae TaxID=251747 RepID=UPI000AA4C7F3|nr:hypothetical protein [Chromobacterium subtsugae]